MVHLSTDTTTYSATPKQTGPYPTLPQPDTTHAKGQTPNVPDPRFPANLPNGPYQITHYVAYPNAYVGDPIHRFYQMWQQVDGGLNDLFTWVHQTSGDDNGAIPPAPIHQGAADMGYYNMAQGDAPVLKFMADHYALADNYHQSIMGGTGANHVAIGTGYAASYQANGRPAVPPANQIENPNPKPGTNNNYTQDGYAGGSYSDCSDRSAPGVAAIFKVLYRQPNGPFNRGDCAPGTYYLLNNYNPGYLADGTPAPLGPQQFTVPPQSFPTIGDSLSARGITWKYYGQGWNNGHPTAGYCNICNPFQYATSVMTDPAKRANLQGQRQFDADVSRGSLPAVSFLKPDGTNDGHPAASSLSQFEGYTADAIDRIMAHPQLFASTAIMVTQDEGGGYYDSGYIQPIDFFGDGTRVPTLVVSPWAKAGAVDHTYYDHASLLKFIERNWRLPPLSPTSRDNLANPVSLSYDRYVPVNGPAIGDLMAMFDFRHLRTHVPEVPMAGSHRP